MCLKGTKNLPIKHSQSYFYLMMYIFIEMLLSFKITFNILCETLVSLIGTFTLVHENIIKHHKVFVHFVGLNNNTE